METNKQVLSDLIKINNDRVKGYEKAAKETNGKDVDLRMVFNDMAAESRMNVEELERYETSAGPSPADSTTLSGDIYRMWMDLKATFTGKDRKAILSSCEYGEDAAQKAYEKALSSTDLSADIRTLVTNQKTRLRRSHDKIKRMRDTQPA